MAWGFIFLICGFCTMVLLSLVLLVMLDRQRNTRKIRLQRAADGFVQSAVKEEATEHEAPKEQREKSTLLVRLMARLEAARLGAGFQFSIHELLAQFAMSVVGLYAFSVLILNTSLMVALFLSITIPALGMLIVFRAKRARHVASFTAGLPEALDVFARGLKAGRPVVDSVTIVVENSKGPVKTEFERCRDELNVGASLLGSLERLCTRMPTQEVVFFSVATSLQSETGGNLIETIENLADQLRERRKLKKKSRALSSEARASAVVLASLPFAVSSVLAVLNPSYLLPLFQDSRGQVMAVAALLSIVFGVLLMARMGKLDV